MNKLTALFALLILGACAKVEPGYAGILVNQYGNQRGVEDFPIKVGRVTYNPFTESLYTFPTFNQTVNWSHEEKEDITFNSIEGSNISADVSVSYCLVEAQVPAIFLKFRKPIEGITDGYMRGMVRDAFQRHAGEMKIIDIFGSQKQELLTKVKADLVSSLSPLGFQIDMVSFTSSLRASNQVMASINATIEASQRAIEAQNKVVQAKAEADQSIEAARGRAESVKLEVDAEAYRITTAANAQAEANRRLNESLTPDLVNYKAIERWNGQTPQFMGGGETGVVPFMNIGR